MPTPAQAHFLRVSAQLAAEQAADGVPLVNATSYELMLAKLGADKRRLKDVQSFERRADIKREVLPDYAPYIDGVLSSDSGVQDDVLMSVMVWRIDAGDYVGALHIGTYAIRHGLHMPDQYQRSTACLIAEEFADAAKRTRDGGQLFDATLLDTTEHLTAEHDMPDEVRAKLHKELGLALANASTQFDALTRALNYLKRATQLNDKVGVKKDIERLERELKNSTVT